MSDHEADQLTNEQRMEVAGKIEEFLDSHTLFRGKNIEVSFAQKGVSSLVSIIDIGERKYVLKVPRRPGMAELEALFLNAWKSAGVAVPEIIDQGMIDTHAYILMEFIDAENLKDHYTLNGLIRERIFVKMGETLRAMHGVHASGFGKPIHGKGEYDDFKSWLLGEDGYAKKKDDIEKLNLLDDSYGPIETVIDILISGLENKSVYCHYDFAPENIFATDPVTVFDPIPAFNHPFMDLARTIVIAVSRCGPTDAASQLLEGYFGKDREYDMRALHAAIVIQAYMKFPYWNKTAQTQRLEYVKEYLLTHRNLLS